MRQKRLLIVNAFLGMLLLGLIYAWSVFVTPLEAEFGWARAQTSLTFSICMAMFSVGSLFGGALVARWSARRLLIAAGVLIGAGFLLTAAVATLWALYLFYGCLCGLGVGLAYNVLLNTTLCHFPGRQGMAAGLLLMGFGFGGSLLGSVSMLLTRSFGWRAAFVLLGGAVTGLMVLISLSVSLPEQLPSPVKTAVEEGFTPRQMVRDPSFVFFYLRGTCVAAVGLAVLGNAAPFALMILGDPLQASLVGGIVSISNGVGRVVGGTAFDRIGSRKSFFLVTVGITLAAAALALAALRTSLPLLLVGYISMGFFYGFGLPGNSGYLSRVYGQAHFGANLSVYTTTGMTGGMTGPVIVGAIFSATGSYTAPYALLTAIGAGALALTTLIRRHAAPGGGR